MSLERSQHLRIYLKYLLPPLTFLILALALFGAGGNDDSHISYWPAWTLATKGAIVSYDGLPLEQSSSMSLVLLLGLLHFLTRAPLPTLGWLVSFGAGLAIVFLLGRRRPLAGGLAACALPFLFWSTSGMESSLLALLLLLTISLWTRFLDDPTPKRRALVAALALATAACRPEAPALLFCMTAAVAAVELVHRSARRRASLELVGWVFAASLFWVGVRLAAFGTWLPHPALMKSGGFALPSGARYLLAAGWGLGWLLPGVASLAALALLFELLRRRRPPTDLLLATAACAAIISFTLVSGGDWMPASRFVAPAVPFFALLAAAAIARLPWRTLRGGTAALLIGSCLWATVDFAKGNQNTGRPHLRLAETKATLEKAWGPLPFVWAELANRAHLRDAGLIPALLHVLDDLEPTDERPLVLLSGQAGMIPFHVFQRHFGKLRFLDLFGLTGDSLSRCVPKKALRRSIFGTGPTEGWVLRNPELLERCGLQRPDVIYGVRLTSAKRKAFKEAGYTLVYEQEGSLQSEHSLFRGGLSASMFIAVRAELRPRVAIPIRRTRYPLEVPDWETRFDL